MKIEILKKWPGLVAVFKPSGMLTIPGRVHPDAKPIPENLKKPVLSEILGAQLRAENLQATQSSDASKKKEPDLFIVHRLDEGTSGIVIFALDKESHKKISQKFEKGEVKKTYWAIVKNKTESFAPISAAALVNNEIKNQIIDAPIFKLPSKKNKSVVDKKGKPSQTLIKQIGENLIEATPLTGRSHQIRVHLAHIGFPILGDKLYGGETKLTSGVDLLHPLLHAQKLEFKWEQETVGQEDIVSVECVPPKEFQDLI